MSKPHIRHKPSGMEFSPRPASLPVKQAILLPGMPGRNLSWWQGLHTFKIASYPSQNLLSSSGRHSGYLAKDAKAHHLRQNRRFAANSIHFQNTVKGHHIFHGTIRLHFTNDAVVRKESFLGTGTWWPKPRQEHELPWDNNTFLFQDSERMKLAIQTWQISATQSFANGLCRYATPWVGFLMRLTCVKTFVDSHVLRFFHLQYSNHHLIYRWFQKKKDFPGTT